MRTEKDMARAALDRAFEDQVIRLFGVLAVSPEGDLAGSAQRFSAGLDRIRSNYRAAMTVVDNMGDGNA